VAAIWIVGRAGGPGASGRPKGKPIFPVQVEPVQARPVEFVVTAPGSVAAFETVQVTARVAGVVERVHFAEGDAVAQDKVLAEIEPERHRLAAESARASRAKAEAELAEAKASLARREQARLSGTVVFSDEELAQHRTKAQVAETAVAQARSALALAELNLRDALVRAPAEGRIETRAVSTGQYVQPGTVLATVVRREPLLLRFPVREEDAARLSAGMAAGFTVRSLEGTFGARLTHVGAEAAGASRLVEVTARVEDERRDLLRPGSFAQVRVVVGGRADAPVIPQTAVRPSERGFLAFVVEEGVARERVLKLGMRTDDGRIEVRAGLSVGERVVVRGAEPLTDGAAVKVSDGS
jgi:multidrug efflux system membrane fusion protein